MYVLSNPHVQTNYDQADVTLPVNLPIEITGNVVSSISIATSCSQTASISQIDAVELQAGKVGQLFSAEEVEMFDIIMKDFSSTVNWSSFHSKWIFACKKVKLQNPSAILLSRSKDQLQERGKTIRKKK